MRIGVIGEQVVTRGDFANDCGAFACVPPDDEERGRDVVRGEQIEQARSHAWIRAIVKCKCDAAFRAAFGQMMKYGTKDLRGWSHGGPGQHRRGGGGNGRAGCQFPGN